ncbi:hypothetical protein JCM8547_001278 [Rhodosporidiobolus lusitaniae]
MSAMPVRPLPIELVSQIVDEVGEFCRYGEQVNDEAMRANGLAIALVCRLWRPLGTALVWKTVVLDEATSAPPLVEHFKRYPHLPVLLQKMHVCEHSRHDPSTTETADAVKYLWTVCTSLTTLNYASPEWHPRLFFSHHLSLLYGVRDLDLGVLKTMQDPFDTLADIASFPSLSDLRLIHLPRWPIYPEPAGFYLALHETTIFERLCSFPHLSSILIHVHTESGGVDRFIEQLFSALWGRKVNTEITLRSARRVWRETAYTRLGLTADNSLASFLDLIPDCVEKLALLGPISICHLRRRTSSIHTWGRLREYELTSVLWEDKVQWTAWKRENEGYYDPTWDGFETDDEETDEEETDSEAEEKGRGGVRVVLG